MAQTQEIFEIYFTVLLPKSLSHLTNEVLRKAYVVFIKPVAEDKPEEVNDQVVKAGLVELQELQ